MHTKRAIFASVAALAALVPAGTVSAQLANASAATLGLAGNQTAIARGFAAISVNPAGLGMPGSGFSLALVPVQVRAGIDPITLSDLKGVEGQVLTPYRDDWMSRIDAAGGQSGSLGADVSAFALTIGNIGLQYSGVVSADMRLGPEMVEAFLFGNGDPDNPGTARDLTLEGSSFDAFAASTAALSIAKSLPSPGAMSVGATFKYTLGHLLASATADGTATSNPIRVQVDVPMVVSCETTQSGGESECEPSPVSGSGFGLDLGFQWQQGPLHLGAALQNVVNTFAWDATKFSYVPGTLVFDLDNDTTDFDTRPLSEAPAELRASLDDLKFKPILALGGAFDFPMALTVSADLKQRLGDGLDVGQKFNLGVGAEWRGLRIIHLRAGGAVVSDGLQYGGGASLVLGPINLSAGGSIISGDAAETAIVQFGLSFGNR